MGEVHGVSNEKDLNEFVHRVLNNQDGSSKVCGIVVKMSWSTRGKLYRQNLKKKKEDQQNDLKSLEDKNKKLLKKFELLTKLNKTKSLKSRKRGELKSKR